MQCQLWKGYREWPKIIQVKLSPACQTYIDVQIFVLITGVFRRFPEVVDLQQTTSTHYLACHVTGIYLSLSKIKLLYFVT